MNTILPPDWLRLTHRSVGPEALETDYDRDIDENDPTIEEAWEALHRIRGNRKENTDATD